MQTGDTTNAQTMEQDSGRIYIRILLVTLQIGTLSHILLLQLHIHIPQESQKRSGPNRLILLLVACMNEYLNRFQQSEGFLRLLHMDAATGLHDATFHSGFTMHTLLPQKSTPANRENTGSRAALRTVLLQSTATTFHHGFCRKTPRQGS